ncbi:hypothetical protein BGX26_001264 [Mortierella sp. AD094]|nr:hypothetical protein BGX26_001264 [Mortierella sp. AD094]
MATNNNIDLNIGHNWYNDNEAQTNAYNRQLASTEVMDTPELVGNILRFIPSVCLPRCSAINKLWRQSVEGLPRTYKDFMAMEIAQFESRPKRINIHVLKTVVLQYPPDDRHTHSKPGTYQFVFSCQTRSGSIDSYGTSSDLSGSSAEYGSQTHSHHAHHPEHDHGSDSHKCHCGYRSSAIISNVYFKIASSSTGPSGVSGPPPLRSLSPLQISSTSRPRQLLPPHAVGNAASNTENQPFEDLNNPNIPISQLSLSSTQATDSNRTPSPKLRYVPCPYEPTSDSSLDPEDSPPPLKRNTGTDSFGERNPSIKSEDMEGSSISRNVKAEPFEAPMPLQGDMFESSGASSGAAYADSFSHRSKEGHPRLESMDWEQQQSHHHHHRHHLGNQGKQTSSSTGKRPSTSSGSTSKHQRHSRTSRNWSMSIQTYYYQRAATNAMILAARQYMESRESEECSILERTETTRIIWNDSTKQELIWSITPTYMDRANPGDFAERDYDPNWQEQEEQQL